MGCISSKSFTRGQDRVGWYSPMSRTVSTSSNRCSSHEEKGNHAVALKSSSYGALNADAYHGSFLNMGKKGTRYEPDDSCLNMGIKGTDYEPDDSFSFTPNLDGKHMLACAATKPAMREDEKKSLLMCGASKRHGVEVINTWELMEGLEDSARTPSTLRSHNCGKLSIPDKEISFNAFQGSTNAPTSDLSSPVWKKYYMQEDEIVSMNFPFARNLNTPPTGSPFSESPRRAPSRGFLIDLEDSRSVSSIELLDASTIGLKLLLSPANSSFHPSPVTNLGGSHSASRSFDGNRHGVHSANASFDGNSPRLHEYIDNAKTPYRSPDVTTHSSRRPSMESVHGSGRFEHVWKGVNDIKSPYRSLDVTRSSSRKPSMDSLYGSGSPLFDPSLMATFEEALKASTAGVASYDEWLHFSGNETTVLSSSSVDTWASFNTSSDAESTVSFQNRERVSSKVAPIDKDDVKSKAVLASYDMKCPPRGEGKVVLYFTSLRGIRKTYEDCCNLRLILRGLGVQVDERDVWMHSTFKNELIDVLNGMSKDMPQVPQLFIKGRYIGGAEEVKQLHEEGVLEQLMDGLAMGLVHNVCDGCGDARFVPCFNCNGSHKVLNENYEVSECLDCNENGLIMCPMCIT
eukprot:c13601_g1_i1 orf=151-2037(+)